MSKKSKTHHRASSPQPQKSAAQTAVSKPISENILLAGCLLLTFLVFANTFGAQFVNWDDHGYLWLNPNVQPLGQMDLGKIFTSHTHGNYSPLVVLSFCIEHTFDQTLKPGQMSVENFQPFLYHFDNVLLHVGATALAFFFLRALGLRGWGLALGAVLFGIHPMRSESVAWVTERKDVLYGLFYIAALLTYWKYTQEQKTKWYVWTIVLGLLALFSKIQAVSLPLSMLALDWYAGRSLKNGRVWVEKMPFFALSLAFGLVGIHFLGEAEGFKDTGYSLVERFFFATASLWNYLWKIPVPFGLSAYYPYPKSGEIPLLYYASPLVLALIGWWVWSSRKQGRAVLFGMGFFLVNIVFVIQFKGAGKAFMADRFTYIPYLGLFFILAKAYMDAMDAPKKGGIKTLLPYLAGGFVLMCSVLTVWQNQHWKTSIALWENVTAKHPKDALSWSNLGLAYDDLGDYEQSAKAYEKSIQVDPAYFDANYNLAVAFNRLSRHDDAIKMFSRAMEMKPEFAETWYARAQVYIIKGNFGAAIADIEKFDKMDQKEPKDKVQSTLGMALAGAGQHAQAIAAFDRANQIKPDPEYHFRKGNSQASMGDMNAAIASYDAALALSPEYTEAINNKGNAYASQGKFREALDAFDQAIAMKPDAANYRCNRGMAKNAAGDKAGACADWQQAAQVGYAAAQGLLQQFCR